MKDIVWERSFSNNFELRIVAFMFSASLKGVVKNFSLAASGPYLFTPVYFTQIFIELYRRLKWQLLLIFPSIKYDYNYGIIM